MTKEEYSEVWSFWMCSCKYWKNSIRRWKRWRLYEPNDFENRKALSDARANLKNAKEQTAKYALLF